MNKRTGKSQGFIERLRRLFSPDEPSIEPETSIEPEPVLEPDFSEEVEATESDYERILRLHSEGEYEQALVLIQAQLGQGMESEDLFVLKANAESRLGKFALATKSIYSAKQMNSGAVSTKNASLAGEVYSNQSGENVRLGHKKAAKISIDQAISCDPDCAEYYFKRALLNEAWEDPESLLDDLLTAIKKDPDNSAARAKLVEVRLKVRNQKSTVNTFEPAPKLSPVNASLLEQRGLANYQLKKFEAAFHDLNEAIAKGSQSRKAYEFRGYLNLGRGSHQQAYSDFSRSIELGAKHSGVLAHRASALLSLGRLDDALSDLDQAIEKNDQIAWYFKNRALVHQKLGKPSKALWDIEDAVRLEPDNLSFSTIREQMIKEHPVYGRTTQKPPQKPDTQNANQKKQDDLAGLKLELPKDQGDPQQITLDWEPLPPGWWRNPGLRSRLESSFKDAWSAEAFLDRLDFLDGLRPEKICSTKFSSRNTPYYLYHFKGHVVAECPEYGNAVYVLKGTADWSRVFRHSKREIRRLYRGRVRVIKHTTNWKKSLRELVS